MSTIETSPGIDFREIAEEHMGVGGLFVYDRTLLARTAQDLLDIERPVDMTVRYAAKANPHPEIVSLFDSMGLHFDASSAYEAERLLGYGVEGQKISLSSQVLRPTVALRHDMLDKGVLLVATSLRQIRILGNLAAEEIAVRINHVGYGHNNRTNVGGPSSSFGIWHEELPAVLDYARRGDQVISRLHTHIGSGAEPNVWRSVIQKSLAIVERLPDVTTLDIGGGYKIARMPGETSTDMNEVCGVFAEELDQFARWTGRDIGLEIEPGTHLVANAGTLLGRIEEVVETDRYKFLKLNVGMNAILRPSLYGAQHPIEVLNDATEQEEYVVVGPCCESGDILTPAPADPEGILPRILNKAEVDDYVAIGGAGAYCASMSANRYNDIPEATEIVV